jgi:hypothetical protein
MLYLNFSPVVTRENNINYIRIGGNYYSKKGMVITCPDDADLKFGLNANYTIISGANGYPEIAMQDDENLYFLLSSEGKDKDKDSLGNGSIMVLKKQREYFFILLSGESAVVRYGVPCNWTCKLLQLRADNAVIRVRLGYNLPEEFYIIHNKEVVLSSLDDSSSIYASQGIQMPYRTSANSLERDWTSK